MSNLAQFSITVQKQTLAEQVASALEEAILNGEWQAGDALPTEPELAEAFGVSRAVIRDGTRMLAARGLVQAQHGRGVFVTESQTQAFGAALLLALRRNGASVWDVEQFEQMVFPEVCALASTAASDAELATINSYGEDYLALFSTTTEAYWQNEQAALAGEVEQLRTAFITLIHAVFEATHNKVWQLLAGSLLHLRSTRSWDMKDIELEAAIAIERHYVETVLKSLASRDPARVRKVISQLMVLPPQAEEAMRKT
ncbi:MAG: GntR family transcriptional regulator, partial [Candidatus Promineifilaceae bacterium]|nr:GntR family transcriptional regulator [Candidatus Promineifilaceae bacterium]